MTLGRLCRAKSETRLCRVANAFAKPDLAHFEVCSICVAAVGVVASCDEHEQETQQEYKVVAMATKQGTVCIGPRQAARAFHAVRFANDNGRPLNLLVTINFTLLGVEDEAAGQFFRVIWSRVSRWWSYQREKGRAFGPFDCYAVHEHPANGPRHVHWFVRAPRGDQTEFERVVRNRLEKVTGLSCLGKAINFLPVSKAGGVAKYTLKGVDPAYAGHFFLNATDQGFVCGRRLTISRSIGASARDKAGWVRKKTR